MPKQPSKKKMPSWLKWTLISVGSLLALVLIGMLIAWWLFCDMRNAWTTKERVRLEEVVVTKEDVNRLKPTYNKVKQAFSGKASSETTIVLESDDLDKFLAVANEGRRVKEVARFRIEGDKIVVTTDINLNKYPMMAGRYLAGDFYWKVKMDEQAWDIQLVAFKVKDRVLPAWMINRVNKKIESNSNMLRNELAPEWARKVKSLTVQDGKVTVVISK